MGKAPPPDLLPGTLDLLILRTLARSEMHGYGIARHLKIASAQLGRKRLAHEREEFDRMVSAIQSVLAN